MVDLIIFGIHTHFIGIYWVDNVVDPHGSSSNVLTNAKSEESLSHIPSFTSLLRYKLIQIEGHHILGK